MELKEALSKNQIILVVIPKSEYIQKSAEVSKTVASLSQKICFVALNKPYSSIILSLKNTNVNPDKFYFIDVLTATVQTPPNVDNCTFVESPNAITDLSLSFSQAMAEKECDSAIFDAISALIIHMDEASVIKLSQNIMTKVRVSGKKAVFIALKEDSENLTKDLMMFVDAVLEN